MANARRSNRKGRWARFQAGLSRAAGQLWRREWRSGVTAHPTPRSNHAATVRRRRCAVAHRGQTRTCDRRLPIRRRIHSRSSLPPHCGRILPDRHLSVASCRGGSRCDGTISKTWRARQATAKLDRWCGRVLGVRGCADIRRTVGQSFQGSERHQQQPPGQGIRALTSARAANPVLKDAITSAVEDRRSGAHGAYTQPACPSGSADRCPGPLSRALSARGPSPSRAIPAHPCIRRRGR
jgi:hypothetical protein